MRDLNYQLKQLCRQNRDGSYQTQRDRAWMLSQIADQLTNRAKVLKAEKYGTPNKPME